MSELLPFCKIKLQYLLEMVTDHELDDNALRVAIYLALAQGKCFNKRQGVRRMATIKTLTPEEVSIIKARLAKGDFQHRIAADIDLNQGRISEIATGKRFANVPPAAQEASHV